MSFDPLDTDALEERQAADQQRARNELRVAVDDMRWLMNDKRGRRFVWQLLEETQAYSSTFRSGDPHTSAFLEGKRAIGLHLLSMINANFADQYVLMLQEHQNHVRRTGR